MAYLNLDLDLEQHPKMQRLIRMVGPDAALYVIRLWVHAAKFFPETGRLDGYSDDDLHRVMNWTQKEMNLAEKLRFCNFIRSGKKGPYIHDWSDHAGHLRAFKQRAKSAAKKRWSKYATSNAISNATSNAPTYPTIPTKPTLKSEASLKPVDKSTGKEANTYLPGARELVEKLAGKKGMP